MAKKTNKRITTVMDLRDYWFLTITAGFIAGISIQQVLFLLPSYVGIGPDATTPGDFVMQQIASAVIGLVVAFVLLAIRKPR